MSEALTDILMITHNRAEYTARSLAALLDGCDVHSRVWIWHNGPDEATRAVVHSLSAHPRVHRVHYSETNEKLWGPTNWLWRETEAKYVGKVDDDCLVPAGWSSALRRAHEAVNQLGVIACSRLRTEDVVDELVQRKLRRFESGHTIVQNCWVAGSGYIMKHECIAAHGPLRPGESFTAYCIRLARAGWLNGFYYPLMFEDHFDDPRSPYTQYRTDDDFRRSRPLTADTFGADTLAEWTTSIMRNARRIQEAPSDPKHYFGWRLRARRLAERVGRLRKAVSRSPA